MEEHGQGASYSRVRLRSVHRGHKEGMGGAEEEEQGRVGEDSL